MLIKNSFFVQIYCTYLKRYEQHKYKRQHKKQHRKQRVKQTDKIAPWQLRQGIGVAKPTEHEQPVPNDRHVLAKMVMTLFDKWKLSTEDQAALLDIASNHAVVLSNARSGKLIGTSRDQYERLGHLLGIHKHLRLLFPQNPDLAYRWITTNNKAFDNRTPIEVIKEWGFAGLLMVRAYLDRTHGFSSQSQRCDFQP